MRYVLFMIVDAVEHKQTAVSGYVRNRGQPDQEMVVERADFGWFITFGKTAWSVGDEKPELKAGDRVRITIEKIELMRERVVFDRYTLDPLALAAEIEEALVGYGLGADDRPFRSELTFREGELRLIARALRFYAGSRKAASEARKTARNQNNRSC